MSFLIKFVIIYVLVAVFYVWLINFVDEHAADMWNKVIETFEDVMDRIDQFISERSENEEE